MLYARSTTSVVAAATSRTSPWMNVIHPERWLAGVPFEQVVNDANVTGPDECARSRNATGQTRQERRHRTMWIPKCFGREPSCMVLPSTLAVTVFQFSGEFLELAVVFMIFAIVAAVLGARGVAGVSMTAARWLIITFIVLAVISAVL